MLKSGLIILKGYLYTNHLIAKGDNMGATAITRNGERSHQLLDIGFKYSGEEFTLDDIRVHWTDVVCDTDKKWKSTIESITKEIERRKK